MQVGRKEVSRREYVSFKMRRRSVPWSCVLLLLVHTAACFASRVLTDETGRKVTLPDHPHRIICLVPSIADTVFSIGAADDVIAVSEFTRYPAAAARKPVVGSILSPSVEKILSLHPDLLLASPYRNQQTVLDQFARLGLPVYLVDPHGLAGILRSVRSLGQATAHEAEASALAARLQRRLDNVRTAVRGKPAVSVFMPISFDPVITIGRGSFVSEIIAAAGGRSVTADLPEEWPTVSMEAVMARAPEALVLGRDGRLPLGLLRTRPGWDSLPAVRTGRIYFVDGRVELPSPVAIDALEDLARQFHP